MKCRPYEAVNLSEKLYAAVGLKLIEYVFLTNECVCHLPHVADMNCIKMI